MIRTKLCTITILFFLNTCLAQKYIKFIKNDVNSTIEVNEKESVLGVFKVKNVGYQGYSEQEINDLPEFIVKPGKNITQKINSIIEKASKTITNGKKGGKVVFKKGHYIVNGIHLKSNVHIRLMPNVVLEPDQSKKKDIKKAKLVFGIGRNGSLHNVSILGFGKGNEVPIIKYKRESDKPKQGGVRAFSIGPVTDLFIQNILIKDDQTRFSGVAFFQRKKKGKFTEAGRAKNVTVDLVKQTNAAYGYGLIQANAGKNLLFTNLSCSGGVCARIETDNRSSKSPFGVDNVYIKNVTSTRGKAAVYLYPHSVISGNVYVDGVYAVNSQMAVEIKPSRNKEGNKGRFGEQSSIKNVSAVYGLKSTIGNAGKKNIPVCLLKYFKRDSYPDKESLKGIKIGPSVCVIGDFSGQFNIDVNTVKAYIPENETNPDNTVESRKTIITQKAYRGKNKKKFCGVSAYQY